MDKFTSKFLRWLTREREEWFYGMAIVFAMGLMCVHGMEICRHPVHIEVNHQAMEEAYKRVNDDLEKTKEEARVEREMRLFEEQMRRIRRESEEAMREFDLLEREVEIDRIWREKEDTRLREMVHRCHEQYPIEIALEMPCE
jgi:hypothetical protein